MFTQRRKGKAFMPKSKEQYEEMRQKSKDAIITAALNLFVANGYHATSINMIAREAGIAIGLMYHYFKSKEELLTYIMKEHLMQIQALALRELGSKTGEKDIRAVIDALFSAIAHSRDSWRLIITVIFQPDVAAGAKQLIEDLSMHQQVLYEKYFEGIGAARPEESARTLGALMHGALLAYALSSDDEDIRLIRDNVIDRLLASGV
jgi:AcrR family transcriptional regulator